VPAERVRAFAPGRVNLIGEHTDYNEGLCLPFAIERGVTVTASPVGGREIDARALDLEETLRFTPGREDPPSEGWRAFVLGAAAELREHGVELRPCRLEISGDLPRGGGLGSSAALTVALGLALCAAADAEPPPPLDLARLCSRVENEWVGQRTGLLDQLASLHGERARAIRIDMRGPLLRPVTFDLGGHRLALLDSGVPRDLAAAGYNERRAECEAAARELGLASLRDARPEDAERLPDPLAGRVRHVTAETARVDRMVAALRDGDAGLAARLLDECHASLRDDFDCSTPQVEAARERAEAAGAEGARMVGGGFGGHVLALFGPDAALPGDAFEVAPGPGAVVS
jgi:galactokinase